MDDFPKERQILCEYRQLLHSILINGLCKWHKFGLFDKITNGEQFDRALEMLKSQLPATEMDAEKRSKFIEDSKYLKIFKKNNNLLDVLSSTHLTNFLQQI